MCRFIDAKTFLQTNRKYEDGLHIPVDAIVIHPHNIVPSNNIEMHNSWKEKAASIGRMFFANSDDLNEYWKGGWDGLEHPGDLEIDKNGQPVMCSGIRPYMLPTDGWITYLQNKKVLPSLDNGIGAILPEEPLAHIFTGYEDSFKKEYEAFFSAPWQAESGSELAFYRTGCLKALLYNKLETALMVFTKDYGRKHNKEIHFVIPIHSLFSNKASGLVAPLGVSLQTNGYDGYVGQIWTGPVNWCLSHYDSPEKSFFASALIQYDYFVQLTVGTNKKLWLEVDPVEDDPNHGWDQFKQWYQHCTTAMLMMKDVDSYEILPWPERIFQKNSFTPGIDDFAAEPAPKSYLSVILSATQVLQDVPKGGDWLQGCKDSRIGIAIADSAMWQNSAKPVLQGLFGLRMPLLQRGITASSVVMERSGDPDYLSRFRIIVLSFEDWKPYSEEMVVNIAQWVFGGGGLLILGKDGDPLDNEKTFWWHKKGYTSPLQALLDTLGCQKNKNEWEYGCGKVLYEQDSPKEFSLPSVANERYISRIEKLSASIGVPLDKGLGYFAVKRGDFIIAHSEMSELQLKGHFVDVFNPDLPVLENITLAKTHSGVFKEVTETLRQNDSPKLLHTTYRLIYEEYADGILKFFIKGPENTSLTARIYKGDLNIKSISAISNGGSLALDRIDDDHRTCRLVGANQPQGVLITVTFK